MFVETLATSVVERNTNTAAVPLNSQYDQITIKNQQSSNDNNFS